MAEQPCLPQVQGLRMRVANLNANGSPVVGASASYISKSFVKIDVTPTYKTATEIDQENASGESCVNYLPPPTYKRDAIAVQLCSPDPYLQAILSGGKVLTGFDGARVGYAGPALGPVTGNGISLEVWALRIDNGAQDQTSPYAHWAYPLVKSLQVGTFSHTSGAVLPQYSGDAYENKNWGDGPGNDFLGTTDRTNQWIPTAAIPAAACGYVATVAS